MMARWLGSCIFWRRMPASTTCPFCRLVLLGFSVAFLFTMSIKSAWRLPQAQLVEQNDKNLVSSSISNSRDHLLASFEPGQVNICTQVVDEEKYLSEWIYYHSSRPYIHSICLITEPRVGYRFPDKLTASRVRTVENTGDIGHQDFSLCHQCLVGAATMTLIADLDEYLNVAAPAEFSRFVSTHKNVHFSTVRFGYVLERLNDSQSTIFTNVRRGPTSALYESKEDIKPFSDCRVEGGWNACNDDSGKTMVDLSVATNFDVHFTRTEGYDRAEMDPAIARLNHYYAIDKEHIVTKAEKWNKVNSMVGIIAENGYWTSIFDDSILRGINESEYQEGLAKFRRGFRRVPAGIES